MVHSNPAFHSYTVFKERVVMAPATPPILMSKRVLDGYKQARPNAPELLVAWYKPVNRVIADVPDLVFGGDVVFITFRG